MSRLAPLLALSLSLAACGGSPPSNARAAHRDALAVTLDGNKIVLDAEGQVTRNSRPFLRHVHDSFVDEVGNLVVVVGADGALMGQGMAMHPHLADNGDMTDETGKLRLTISAAGAVTLYTDGKAVPGAIRVENMQPSDRKTAALLVVASMIRQSVTDAQDKAAAARAAGSPAAAEAN